MVGWIPSTFADSPLRDRRKLARGRKVGCRKVALSALGRLTRKLDLWLPSRHGELGDDPFRPHQI